MTQARQDHIAGLLRDHGPLAPPALRAGIEAELARVGERRTRVPVVRVALGGAVASLVIALALFLPGLLSGAPTVTEVHALSADGPTGPAPAPRERHPQLLAAGLDGLAFPDWEPEFGWRASGRRSDQLDGRRTETVFYDHETHRIAYTIVSGNALDPPADATRRRIDGVELYASRDSHGHDIVSFERGGMTCVVSGHVEELATILELASWRGDGRVGF